MIRYVHLNPIRAGICDSIDDLDTFQWSGHAVLMGNIRCPFQTTNAVLHRFGTTVKSSRKQYRNYIEEGICSVESKWIVEAVRKSNHGIDKKDKPSCWVIGDREFVLSVMEKHKRRLRARGVLRKKWSIEDVFKYLAREYKVAAVDLEKRSRLTEVSACRQRCAFICCRILGYKISEVAEYMKISGPAVSWAINKGKDIVSKKDIVKFNNLPPG